MDCECGEKDIETEVVGVCSCHVNPPCSACVDAPYVCRSCGEQYEIEHPKTKAKPNVSTYKPFKRRTLDDLDRNKIDSIPAGGGWHSGMEVHGYCPTGTTRGDVLMHMRLAENPNMPRFSSFKSGGYFKLSYFTD